MIEQFDLKNNFSEFFAKNFLEEYKSCNFDGQKYIFTSIEKILYIEKKEDYTLLKEQKDSISNKQYVSIYGRSRMFYKDLFEQNSSGIYKQKKSIEINKFYNTERKCTFYFDNKISRLEGPAKIHATNRFPIIKEWYYNGKRASKLYKINGVSSVFKKGNKVGIILEHLKGPFYLGLIGDQKKLFVDAFDYDSKMQELDCTCYKKNFDRTSV